MMTSPRKFVVVAAMALVTITLSACGPADAEMDGLESQKAEAVPHTCLSANAESYVSSEEACDMAKHASSQLCSGLGGIYSSRKFCLYADSYPYVASHTVCCVQ